MGAVTQYWVKIVLGFVALLLFVLSTPILGGPPLFAFTTAFQGILVVAVIGAFGWSTVQGSAAVNLTATPAAPVAAPEPYIPYPTRRASSVPSDAKSLAKPKAKKSKP